MSEKTVTLRVKTETAMRLNEIMKSYRLIDLDRALNALLDQVEIAGLRRRTEVMDEVERIFTLKCPYLDRNVSMNQCRSCQYCEVIDDASGCVCCGYGEVRELEFMTLCPKLRNPTRLVSCVDCRFGMVSRETGTVVCKYFTY